MKFLFVIFLLPLQLFAQDITGVWTGTLYSDSTKSIKYELALSEYNGTLSGYSHTIFVVDSIENIGVKSVKVKKEDEKFLIEDDKLIYNNYTAPPAKGVKMYSELLLSQNDTVMVLTGSWKTNRTKQYAAINGIIFLQKKKKIGESLLVTKLEDLKLTSSLSFMPPPAPAGTNNVEKLNKPAFTSSENKTPVTANGTENITSGPPAPSTAGNEQSAKPVSAEVVINKKDEVTNNNKRRRENIQMPPADKSTALKKDSVQNENSPPQAGSVNSKNDSANIVLKPSAQPIVKGIAGSSVSTTLEKDSNNKSAALVSRAASEIATRKIEAIKSVDIKSDSLVLTLYDNGEVDGDTVSVLLNGKVIMPMEGLSLKAISKTVYLTPEMGDSAVLIMYAENLGSIPPNTGLLVVHDGEDVYEIRFSGDLTKNSSIILRKKRKR